AVDEQPQVIGVTEFADGPQLRQRVAGPQLRGLGDGHGPGLSVVFVAPAAQVAGDPVRGDLAVRGWDSQQFGAEDLLSGAAFVGVDVRGLGTDHRLVPPQQEAEPPNVGGPAVEDEEHVTLGPEQLAQLGGGPARPLVFAVRRGVAGVGGDDRVHYGLVGPGVVVASETLVLTHDSNLLRRPGPRRAGVAVKGGVTGRMWRRHGPPA